MLFFFYIFFIALVCGKTPRIVGGDRVTDTTSIPWLVAIIKRNVTEEANGIEQTSDYFNRQFCGGSIIDAAWILTAAHCFEDMENAEEVSIVAATYDLSTTMGQLRNAETIYMHAEYNPDTTENDIALIKLDQRLLLSESVAIILPANMDDPFEDGQMYTLAGWGANDMNGTVHSPDLYTVDVPGVSLESCSEVLDDIFYTNLCAGGVYGEDSCSGDSGGPMSMTVDSIEILYGIVSWGPAQCATSSPAVYTDVAMYRTWIEDISGLELGNKALIEDDSELPGWIEYFGHESDNPGSTRNSYQIHTIIGIVFGVVLLVTLIAVICRTCSKLNVDGKTTSATQV